MGTYFKKFVIFVFCFISSMCNFYHCGSRAA